MAASSSSDQKCCCSSLFGALWLLIGPIVSIVLGLITGTVFGLLMTVLVCTYTLVRTPLHIAKMMYVTATTTEECFRPYPHYLDPILRIAVLLLVPLVHVLWLVGVAVVAVTYGTLYYIATLTKLFYLHAYRKMLSTLESNVKLDEEDSFFGSYVSVTAYRDFMKSDEPSYCPMYVLKAMCAIVPGVPLGLLPLIPYTIGVLVITIYRFPINVYKTMKIALCTVVLQWDLKLAALVMLPFAHVLFPLVAFATAMVGSFCYFTFATTRSIFEGKNPFEKWYKVKVGLTKYYQAHQQFIGKDYCDKFDHPTGIPIGWEGESYGVPIQKIVRWQWDFLVCCFLLFVIGFPVCFVGSVLIFVVKLVPGTVSWWRNLWKDVSEKSAAQILGCWTFYLLAFVLVPVGTVFVSLIAIAVGTLCSFRIPGMYLEGGYSVGCYAPFKLLHEVDGWDLFDLGDGFYVLLCLRRWEVDDTAGGRQDNGSNTNRNNSYRERIRYSEEHWDRFANQCIRSASGLLAKKWITLDDLQCIEPSVAQAIPAVAILEILVDTITDGGTQEEHDILWTIDGTRCKGKDRPQLENVAAFLWPKVYQVKWLLLSKTEEKQRILCATQNVKILTAMLCSNTDETTDALKEFVVASSKQIDEVGQPHSSAVNKQIRTQLVDLSLGILQVKPFRDRMSIIFDYGYVETGIDVSKDQMATTTASIFPPSDVGQLVDSFGSPITNANNDDDDDDDENDDHNPPPLSFVVATNTDSVTPMATTATTTATATATVTVTATATTTSTAATIMDSVGVDTNTDTTTQRERK